MTSARALPAALLCCALARLLGGCGGDAVHSHLPAEGDAVTLQQIFDGKLAAAEGLAAVARAGGWPIAISQGFLFAIADGGQGPYQLESPTHGFNTVKLTSEAGVAWTLVTVAQSTNIRSQSDHLEMGGGGPTQ